MIFMRNCWRRLLLALLAVWMTGSVFMVPVLAVDGYTIDGIDVYRDPAAAAEHFTVEKMIWFSADGENAWNDSRVMVVSTMDDLLQAAKEYPFAALVVDTAAEPLLERDRIVRLAKTQHLILIIGFDTARRGDTEMYEKLTGMKTDKYNDTPGFAAYYVVSATGEICLWDMVWGRDFTADGLLDFAERTKDGTFYLYDCLVLQEHPEFADEINNAPVPDENLVIGLGRPPRTAIRNLFSGAVYAPASAGFCMTAGELFRCFFERTPDGLD